MDIQQFEKIILGIECNSYNRFDYFFKYRNKLKGADYWQGLSRAYTSSDNLYYYRNFLKKAFTKNEPEREKLMNQEEIEYLLNLPDQFPIFRGMTELERESGNLGVSWTLKREIAEFFINDYFRNHDTHQIPKVLFEKVVSKNEVIAFFNERQEFEIIHIHQSR